MRLVRVAPNDPGCPATIRGGRFHAPAEPFGGLHFHAQGNRGISSGWDTQHKSVTVIQGLPCILPINTKRTPPAGVRDDVALLVQQFHRGNRSIIDEAPVERDGDIHARRRRRDVKADESVAVTMLAEKQPIVSSQRYFGVGGGKFSLGIASAAQSQPDSGRG